MTTKTITFYHPFALSGGGGERVLWAMIATMKERHEKRCYSPQYRHDKLNVVIICADDPPPLATLSEKILSSFNISTSLSDDDKSFCLSFVTIGDATELLSPESYPRFTMIGQSIGSIKVVTRALKSPSCPKPDVFIDTTGAIFTLLAVKYYARSAKTAAYVHYPTVSTDMLSVQRSPFKVIYYILFAIIYGIVGSLCDIVMVNSNWTRNHIRSLWRFGATPQVLFPPCEVTGFLQQEKKRREESTIVSVAQFRPEKDHKKQIDAVAALNDEGVVPDDLKLVLIGSCRNKDDLKRVAMLKEHAAEKGLEDKVEFLVNQSFSVLKEMMGTAGIGIHTMFNEHFGIGIVEMQAAGLITIAHGSGGPREDIIGGGRGYDRATKERTGEGSAVNGLLACSTEEYATAIKEVLNMNRSELGEVRRLGVENSSRFSGERFAKDFVWILVNNDIM